MLPGGPSPEALTVAVGDRRFPWVMPKFADLVDGGTGEGTASYYPGLLAVSWWLGVEVALSAAALAGTAQSRATREDHPWRSSCDVYEVSLSALCAQLRSFARVALELNALDLSRRGVVVLGSDSIGKVLTRLLSSFVEGVAHVCEARGLRAERVAVAAGVSATTRAAVVTAFVHRALVIVLGVSLSKHTESVHGRLLSSFREFRLAVCRRCLSEFNVWMMPPLRAHDVTARNEAWRPMNADAVAPCPTDATVSLLSGSADSWGCVYVQETTAAVAPLHAGSIVTATGVESGYMAAPPGVPPPGAAAAMARSAAPPADLAATVFRVTIAPTDGPASGRSDVFPEILPIQGPGSCAFVADDILEVDVSNGVLRVNVRPGGDVALYSIRDADTLGGFYAFGVSVGDAGSGQFRGSLPAGIHRVLRSIVALQAGVRAADVDRILDSVVAVANVQAVAMFHSHRAAVKYVESFRSKASVVLVEQGMALTRDNGKWQPWLQPGVSESHGSIMLLRCLATLNSLFLSVMKRPVVETVVCVRARGARVRRNHLQQMRAAAAPTPTPPPGRGCS